MDAVSQKYYIKLDQQITCEFICQQAQKIVTQFQKANGQDLSEALLILEVKNISHTAEANPICKLEFKN